VAEPGGNAAVIAMVMGSYGGGALAAEAVVDTFANFCTRPRYLRIERYENAA